MRSDRGESVSPGRHRTSRLAAWALAAVLVAMSGFALWASQHTASVTEKAVAESRLSNLFATAARAVSAEESLERKYRLEPGPEVLRRYEQAAADLVAALQSVVTAGNISDRAAVDQALRLHAPYLAATRAMFAAVDSGNDATVLKIDGVVDAMFGSIETIVDREAATHHDRSLRDLATLSRLERFTSTATPLVFLVGLLLVVFFAAVLRRVRRQLDVQGERAHHDALHDALTGLPNRVLLSDRLDQALRAQKRGELMTALLLVDLDRFKEVNDTLGHHYGDDLLKAVGPRWAPALRDMDTVARLGGDEFAVLLPNTEGLAAAIAVAERLRRSLVEPFAVRGVDLSIDASIGVVVSGLHGDDPATLLQRADVAMYVAKEQGIGVFAYDPDHDGHSTEKLSLLAELRHAIEHDELVVHYQPQVSLSTGLVSGVEALVRWQHPTRGLVPPDQFIPLAEHTALIGPLTSVVLDRAVGQARAWLDAGHRIPVSVNFSARSLHDEHLVDLICEALVRHGLSADLLQVEVTESAIMSEPARARATLERLHALGLRISIDDFGAGYTSLAQLKNLPVTELKVDRSFVMSMDSDRSDALIVQSVVELGHNLGLTVVAEGVETEASFDTLGRFGCDVAQGYHLSRPIPPAAVLGWCIERDAGQPVR